MAQFTLMVFIAPVTGIPSPESRVTVIECDRNRGRTPLLAWCWDDLGAIFGARLVVWHCAAYTSICGE